MYISEKDIEAFQPDSSERYRIGTIRRVDGVIFLPFFLDELHQLWLPLLDERPCEPGGDTLPQVVNFPSFDETQRYLDERAERTLEYSCQLTLQQQVRIRPFQPLQGDQIPSMTIVGLEILTGDNRPIYFQALAGPTEQASLWMLHMVRLSLHHHLTPIPIVNGELRAVGEQMEREERTRMKLEERYSMALSCIQTLYHGLENQTQCLCGQCGLCIIRRTWHALEEK